MPKAISRVDEDPATSRRWPLRGVLKLIIEAGSSRSMVSRISAGTILLALLAAFGGVGYFLPTLLSRYL